MPVYQEIFKGPARNYTTDAHNKPRITKKKYLVIHNTSNKNLASADNEATYAKRRTDGVSSHYYCDKTQVIQSMDTDWRAQHVGSTKGNDHGISYEITGKNSSTAAWWMQNVAWDALAKQMARDCKHHKIDPQLLTVAEMKAGVKTGIVTHDMCRQAWGGTDHTDPGPNFPMDHLLTKLKAALQPPPAPPKPPVPESVPAPTPEPVPAPPVPPVIPPVPQPHRSWISRVLAILWQLLTRRGK